MEDFGELIELIRNKKLIIEPPEVYPIEDTARALIKFLERKNLGKAVIKF